MDARRSRALRLRLLGKSYNEISRSLNIPKSTLSGWLRNVVLNDRARKRLEDRERAGGKVLIKRNKLQTKNAENRTKEIFLKGMKEVPNLKPTDLLVTGAVMYWAEGYKRKRKRQGREIVAHPISFVNSDPEMVRIFILFLFQILAVPKQKIVLTMRLYAHINESTAREYWKKVTDLQDSHFRKTTYLVSLSSKGKRAFNTLPFGTLQVSVNSTDTFYRLMGIIEGVKKQ